MIDVTIQKIIKEDLDKMFVKLLIGMQNGHIEKSWVYNRLKATIEQQEEDLQPYMFDWLECKRKEYELC